MQKSAFTYGGKCCLHLKKTLLNLDEWGKCCLHLKKTLLNLDEWGKCCLHLKKTLLNLDEWGKCCLHLKKTPLNLDEWSKCCLRLKKTAFTLAEVLMVLSIIGVVAAITIPNIVANYQKSETLSILKNTYSILMTAVNTAIEDEGSINSWDITFGDAEKSQDFTNKYILPYLKISKNCEMQNTSDCFWSHSSLDGSKTKYNFYNFSKFFLANGVFIAISCRFNDRVEFYED